MGHNSVVGCAVIGAFDTIKGEVPVGLVVLKPGQTITDKKLKDELVAKVRREIGPVAAFRDVLVIPQLPKTLSGKILRGVMKKQINGMAYKHPATIVNPESLPEVLAVMKKHGFGVKKDIKFDPKL